MVAGVLVLIPAGTFVLQRLLPEKELRLELLFLANALIAVLGVIHPRRDKILLQRDGP